MMFRRVVLPQPDGPTMQTNSPRWTVEVDLLQDVNRFRLPLAWDKSSRGRGRRPRRSQAAGLLRLEKGWAILAVLGIRLERLIYAS